MYTGATRHVLLVEDDPVVSMKEEQVLTEHGFLCHSVVTGEEAVAAALGGTDFDLVLMDLELGGGIDGAEAARRILARVDTPVLFLTGHAEDDYIELIRDLSHYGYLLKNVGEAVLIESVETTIRLSGRLKRLNRENSRRQRAEAELEAAWRRIPVPVALIDRHGRIRRAGGSAAELARAAQGHLTGKRLGEAFRCAHLPQSPQQCGDGPKCAGCRLRRAGEVTFGRRKGLRGIQAQFEVSRNGASETRSLIMSTSWLDLDGQPYALLCAEDVTRLKHSQEALEAALEEKQHLLAEFNHRVKNHFAVVGSLIRLKDKDLGDRADLSGLSSQVRAFERIHRQLQETGPSTRLPFRDYMTNLVMDVLSSGAGAPSGPPRIEVDVADVEIPARMASTLGLIVVELATNAAKYGFRSTDRPRFSVSFKVDSDAQHYVLTVSNTGRPFPPDVDIEDPKTLGLRLVAVSVIRGGGTIELEREPYPVFTIRMPMPVDRQERVTLLKKAEGASS